LLTRWQDLLLEGLERVFLLSGQGGSLVLPFDRVLAALVALVDSLGADPASQTLRVRLAKLLGPSIAGMTGLALMASVAMKLASRPVEAEPTIIPGTAGADWLSEHEPFLRSAFESLKSEEPLVIGRTVLPKELVIEPADEVLSALMLGACTVGPDDVLCTEMFAALTICSAARLMLPETRMPASPASMVPNGAIRSIYPPAPPGSG
jgi:hypothetical protein